MSLYENINRRRKLGISRSKADSTISKSSYSNMKKGFPEKAKTGKVMNKQKKVEDIVDVDFLGAKAKARFKKALKSKDSQFHSKTYEEGVKKAYQRAINETKQEDKVKLNFNKGGFATNYYKGLI